MADEDKGISISSLIAYSIAGMALAASVVLAYYVSQPRRLLPAPDDTGTGGDGAAASGTTPSDSY